MDSLMWPTSQYLKEVQKLAIIMVLSSRYSQLSLCDETLLFYQVMPNVFSTMSVDADALTIVSGQTGTLVMDRKGLVSSATGELCGTSGEIAAETIYSMLQDSNSILDTNQKEELQRMTIAFPTYDFVVTLDTKQIYVVKRNIVQE
ncbi:putative ragulator complex protein LAMTOR4 [Plasmopara halstedii]